MPPIAYKLVRTIYTHQHTGKRQNTEHSPTIGAVIIPPDLSFHSVSLQDALKAPDGPVEEVHISNILARDIHHRHSITSTAANGVICSMGP